jgi:predicted Holliday junction resolvase-like endonuclease
MFCSPKDFLSFSKSNSKFCLFLRLKGSKLAAKCPKCDGDFKLADSLLFDGTKTFPYEAEEIKQNLLEAYSLREKELKKRKVSVDSGAEQKAIDVGFGKIIEKFIPAYKELNLQFAECRPLFDPIDLIVFDGLLNRKVEFVHFTEIKSGNSTLNKHQKLIRNAVLDKRVDLEVL